MGSEAHARTSRQVSNMAVVRSRLQQLRAVVDGSAVPLFSQDLPVCSTSDSMGLRLCFSLKAAVQCSSSACRALNSRSSA
jgi:hypothetical protein